MAETEENRELITVLQDLIQSVDALKDQVAQQEKDTSTFEKAKSETSSAATTKEEEQKDTEKVDEGKDLASMVVDLKDVLGTLRMSFSDFSDVIANIGTTTANVHETALERVDSIVRQYAMQGQDLTIPEAVNLYGIAEQQQIRGEAASQEFNMAVARGGAITTAMTEVGQAFGILGEEDLTVAQMLKQKQYDLSNWYYQMGRETQQEGTDVALQRPDLVESANLQRQQGAIYQQKSGGTGGD